MKVIALPEVDKYLQNLITILYKKEYFGFEEAAQKYVDDLYDDIETNLPICLHKPAPSYFDKYGKNMEYAIFKKSKHTHGNNHTVAQYL